MDKKALKEAGKKYVDKAVESVKRFNKGLVDPFGVKGFIKDYKSSKKKHQRTESRVAQRTGNKYMIGKKTTKVKQKGKIQKERPRGGLKAGGLAKRGYGISKRGR